MVCALTIFARLNSSSYVSIESYVQGEQRCLRQRYRWKTVRQGTAMLTSFSGHMFTRNNTAYATEGNAPAIPKKRRTMKNKPSPSQTNLEIVNIAQDVVPLQIIDPTPAAAAVNSPVPKQKSRKRRLILPTGSDDESIATQKLVKDTDEAAVKPTDERMDNAQSDILSRLHTVERGLRDTLGQQNEYFRNLIQSARQDGQNQDIFRRCVSMHLRKLFWHKVSLLVPIRWKSGRRSKHSMLKLINLDGQVAAIRSEQLEIQAKIAADILILSTQLGDLVDYIRGGDAKKGEEVAAAPTYSILCSRSRQWWKSWRRQWSHCY
ncbi:ATPase family AAA domain-containing protein [Dorcoceras hygrometricum]|uniref:ATPase family AAA domain-containing protein n=1 Tax=Dorcoceras hygrometricum TaxID=472368 RepID=A0A2Z7C3S1_9LAMI|nr:ATPase family AAA domain-containing protein [Dorcoceras hygrometricum]